MSGAVSEQARAPTKQRPAAEQARDDDVGRGVVDLKSLDETLTRTKPKSEWERWVTMEKAKAAETSRRRADYERMNSPPKSPQSARVPRTGTRRGTQATKERLQAMEHAVEKEKKELEELKQLLGRTLYTGGGNNFIRAGRPATLSLRKLDDGQNDSVADAYRRRVEEEALAAEITGRPAWDSSPMRYVPTALRGVQPVTPEPWAHDHAVYEEGMNGHGATKKNWGGGNGKHVEIIASDIVNYRKEMGTGKPKPLSARHQRTWDSAGMPSGRTNPTTGRSTRRSLSPNSSRGSPSPEKPLTGRAAKIRDRLIETGAAS